MFVPLLGLVLWLASVTHLLLEMLYFCVLVLAGNSMSLLKGKLVSKMLGLSHFCDQVADSD